MYMYADNDSYSVLRLPRRKLRIRNGHNKKFHFSIHSVDKQLPTLPYVQFSVQVTLTSWTLSGT